MSQWNIWTAGDGRPLLVSTQPDGQARGWIGLGPEIAVIKQGDKVAAYHTYYVALKDGLGLTRVLCVHRDADH